MIDYATWCAIRDGIDRHLTADQLAGALNLDVKTVRRWIGRPYAPRQAAQRGSKLDPFKGRIVRWLETHPLSAQQVFQRLGDEGYGGGISIVKDYVRLIRPRPREAFLTLAFAPGEVAQVDWGEFGTIAVGDTRRRLSFFVLVLAWSRMMYVEFTLSQTMEQFLAAHVNAFHALGVPKKVMVDNLRCAVLRHPRGEHAEFNGHGVIGAREHRAGQDVLARVEDVVDALALLLVGHHLHQPLRPRARDHVRVVVALDLDDGADERLGDGVEARGLGDVRVIARVAIR